MSGRSYGLKAEITTAAAARIKAVLIDIVGVDAIMETETGFMVRTSFQGDSAQDLNRRFFSALQRVSKKTTMKSEWTHEGVTERFFDYVPKGISEA